MKHTPKTQDKGYLLKRRRYGWGWTPVSWKAWALIIMQIGIIITAATFLPAKPLQPSIGELIAFLVIVALAVATMVVFSLAVAPKAAWRWGKKPSDNPDEDF